jgi:hypothetical protein
VGPCRIEVYWAGARKGVASWRSCGLCRRSEHLQKLSPPKARTRARIARGANKEGIPDVPLGFKDIARFSEQNYEREQKPRGKGLDPVTIGAQGRGDSVTSGAVNGC